MFWILNLEIFRLGLFNNKIPDEQGPEGWAGGWPASHHPQQDPCWCLASRGGEGHHPGAQREHGLQQAVWGGALSLSGTTLQDTKVVVDDLNKN